MDRRIIEKLVILGVGHVSTGTGVLLLYNGIWPAALFLMSLFSCLIVALVY